VGKDISIVLDEMLLNVLQRVGDDILPQVGFILSERDIKTCRRMLFGLGLQSPCRCAAARPLTGDTN
jgi:hypothetical protein